MNKHPNTQEQDQVIATAVEGNSFKTMAFAGSGKTSTCTLVGKELKNKKGNYLAFNKTIADEAKTKFSSNVECTTFHSKAWRGSDRDLTAKLQSSKKLFANQIARQYNLVKIHIPTEDGTRVLTQNEQAYVITRALSKFCNSIGNEPELWQVYRSLPEWVPEQYHEEIALRLLPHVESRWLQSINPRDEYQITHDIYLKKWAMSNPRINADFILFDEAQDADPLMLDIMSKQSSQIIYVGDPHQSIYGWRGAVNAMQHLKLQQERLTQSFRFGGEIADNANVLLRMLGEKVPLIGNPNKESICTHKSSMDSPNAVLCRTNIGVIDALLKGIENGKKCSVKLDTYKIIALLDGIDSLKNGQASTHSELSGFLTYADLMTAAQGKDIDSDVKQILKLLEYHDSSKIKSTLESVGKNTDKNSDYIISTAHKAKGMEWNNVEIHNDFFYKIERNELKITDEELRLLYVAVTRGINTLNTYNIDNLLNFKGNRSY